MAETFHFYRKTNEGHEFLYTLSHLNREQAEDLAMDEGYVFGPLPFEPAGIDRIYAERFYPLHDVPAVLDLIKLIRHDPHIWGGGHSPTAHSIHGGKTFSHAHSGQTPVAYNTETDLFPLGAAGQNNALYVDSEVMDGAKAGLVFTAKLSKGIPGDVIVGFAVNEPDTTQGFDGITQGLSFGIDTSNTDFLRFSIKRGEGDGEWVAAYGATSKVASIDIPYTELREDDVHTFRIESSRGLVTLFVDGVQFGTFRYPDDTYPLRKYATNGDLQLGECIGWMVDWAGFHYVVQANAPETSEGFEFSLHDMSLYQLYPESVTHPQSRPDAELMRKIVAKGIPASAIKDAAPIFTAPDRSDDTHAEFVYFGWEDVMGNWVIKRQTRDTGQALSASGSTDFDVAWDGRIDLTYA